MPPRSHRDSATPTPVPPEERVPIKERIAYGFGAVGSGFANAENYIINPVFVLTLGVSPAVMSLLNLIYRVFDGFTDIAMGLLTDRTRTRFGRRKPYIVIGALLVGLWLPVLFLVDPAWSPAVIIGWMVSVRLVATVFDTIYNIPYQCLLLESTPSSVERTNVAAWRGYVSIISLLALTWVWSLTQLPIFNDANGKPDILRGAFWVLSAFGLVAAVTMIMPIFIKERVQVSAAKKKPINEIPLRENLRLTFTSRPFLILVAFTCCLLTAQGIKGALDFYARINYVFEGDQKIAAMVSGVGGTLSAILGFAGIPLFQWLARRRGKIFALQLIMVIGFFSSLSTIVFYVPGLPYLSLIPGLLLAPTSSAIWMLVPSMLGDVCDDDQIRTSERREGSFAAIYSWCFKMAGTLSIMMSGPLVELAGYDASLKEQVQPEAVVTNLRIAVAVIPAVFMALGWWVISRSPLTLDRIAEIHEQLRLRKEAEPKES